MRRFRLTLFFDCHKVWSIVKKRRMSELVAKNTTISSEFSRTSWQENSYKQTSECGLKAFYWSQHLTKTHHNAPPSIALRWNPNAGHFLKRCTRFDLHARVFTVNATYAGGAFLVGCGFVVWSLASVAPRRSNRWAQVWASTWVVRTTRWCAQIRIRLSKSPFKKCIISNVFHLHH